METETLKDILLLVVGATMALGSSWVKASIDRETATSTDVYRQRVQALNEIWRSFLPLRTTFASRITIGHRIWLKKFKETAEKGLEEFRTQIDQNQVILPRVVIMALRDIDAYLFDVLSQEDLKTSDYDVALKEYLKRLTEVVNDSFAKRSHAINLEFRT